jgi:hypothetical protein
LSAGLSAIEETLDESSMASPPALFGTDMVQIRSADIVSRGERAHDQTASSRLKTRPSHRPWAIMASSNILDAETRGSVETARHGSRRNERATGSDLGGSMASCLRVAILCDFSQQYIRSPCERAATTVGGVEWVDGAENW